MSRSRSSKLILTARAIKMVDTMLIRVNKSDVVRMRTICKNQFLQAHKEYDKDVDRITDAKLFRRIVKFYEEN